MIIKIFVGETLCFGKLQVQKKLMGKKEKGEGVSRFSVGFLLSHRTENIPKGKLLCFRNFCYPKVLNVRDGVYHDFLSKWFCLRVRKHFVEEAFGAVFENIFGSVKFFG